MPIKESLEENKQFILDSLPDEELKQEFLKQLEEMEEPTPTSTEELLHEAQAPEYVHPDFYDALKKEIEGREIIVPLTEEETRLAVQQELSKVDTTPREEEEFEQQEDAEAITDYGDEETEG